MEFNRNHYFMLGIVLLFFGVQFRLVEGAVLNDRVGHFLKDHGGASPSEESGGLRPILASITPSQRQTLRPPTWLGWALMSSGSVLVLHSLAMKKPGA